MATLKFNLVRPGARGVSRPHEAFESGKARDAILEAFEKSGGPTPGLKRVYGGYLDYKRANAEKAEG